ncbi:hypothetical protein [Sphingopyxis sp. MWB1]|uniref:hypothetical protein n=1 Tax=Sphingopyxis sp. MWB1 TaxID=1537715 RepID=UPI00051A2E62|nr:hypothetical protein [Sphingopyxis sp. MWB1]
MLWLQENWIVALVVAIVAIALVWWLFARNRPEMPDEVAPPAAPEKPAKPLEPKKPDIIAAEPARFKKPEPAPTAPPAEPPAPPVAAPGIERMPPADAVPSAQPADNLQLMKGVGPKLVTLLNSLGITRFEQIAAWTEEDIAAIDPQLGTFQGRITRDNWVDQAGYLARKDQAGFEAKYGALGGTL